jgi:hypothetical protein
MEIINPVIWLTFIILGYLIGILAYSWLLAFLAKIMIKSGRIVKFKRIFIYCILGGLIGCLISFFAYTIFKETNITNQYPAYNVKLLQICVFLPIVPIVLFSIMAIYKPIHEEIK